MPSRNNPFEYTLEELELELENRGVLVRDGIQKKLIAPNNSPWNDTSLRQMDKPYTQPHSNNGSDLSDISTRDICGIVIMKSHSDIPYTRNALGVTMKDQHEISHHLVKRNCEAVGAILRTGSLEELGNGLSKIIVEKYGQLSKPVSINHFRNQPVAAGRMNTCFLLEKDIIATAGHCVDDAELTDLRIVFGFRMENASTPRLQFQESEIYRAVEIIHRQHINEVANWIFIKLDREVNRANPVNVSNNNPFYNQEVYIIGFPLGLPLKYVHPFKIGNISDDSYFTTNSNLYSGDCGSPVFDSRTHKVLGMVVRNKPLDFRWDGHSWETIIYPENKGTECARATRLIEGLPKQ